MKKILLLLFVLIATTLSAQNSKKVLERDVPQVVIDGFYKNIKLDKSIILLWKFNEKDNTYGATFYRDVLRAEAFILSDGKYLHLYEDLKIKDIPTKINEYVADKMSNATVMAVYRRSQSGGQTYQLKISQEMGTEGRSYSKTQNYIFDPEGNLIKIF